MRNMKVLIPSILILFAIGCDGTSPNKPGNVDRPLAGGGRFDNGDPVEGYPDTNGIQYPIVRPGDPSNGISPIYTAQRDCANSPGERIIGDSAAWKAWWDATTPCQWRGGENGQGWPGDPTWTPGDSGLPCDGRCGIDAPYVDFEKYVVAAVSVEYDSGAFCYRSVWVTDIREIEGKTTIYYEVSKLDQTCCDMLLAIFVPTGFSPVEAVLIERPVSDDVVWVRANTTFDCPGPDPNEPMTLHYTDAPCSLGDGEDVITDSATWSDWFHTAWACDSARSGYFSHPGGMLPWNSGMMGPNGDTLAPWPDSSIWNPYPWWGEPYVDFTTHAIIILRAGEQDHWGGGIWLNDVERSSAGTIFNYSVMQPSDNCPPMGSMGHMGMMAGVCNHTVAIRVPLPIDPPVSWQRHIEPIECNWGNDSTWIERPIGRDSL